MAKNPLFSTYRQGENRVTSSMLAVFERIDLALVERILAAVSEESTLAMVDFVNQPLGKDGRVPDARISANFSFWFETKTSANQLTKDKLCYAEYLEAKGDQRLFLVTPDPTEPELVSQLADPRVTWFNFRSLYDVIEQIVVDPISSVPEQSRFLLREFQDPPESGEERSLPSFPAVRSRR